MTSSSNNTPWDLNKGQMDTDISGSLADACALPPDDYAQQRSDVVQLFATSLREMHRDGSRLLLEFDASSDLEEYVRELLATEQQCCPFFTFTIDTVDTTMRVEVLAEEGAEEFLSEVQRTAARAVSNARAGAS